jgi:hypothetical protein
MAFPQFVIIMKLLVFGLKNRCNNRVSRRCHQLSPFNMYQELRRGKRLFEIVARRYY